MQIRPATVNPTLNKARCEAHRFQAAILLTILHETEAARNQDLDFALLPKRTDVMVGLIVLMAHRRKLPK